MDVKILRHFVEGYGMSISVCSVGIAYCAFLWFLVVSQSHQLSTEAGKGTTVHTMQDNAGFVYK